jgi:predicted TIM-barrel fold metal-dependent hydrolase
LDDADWAVGELTRVARKGLRGVIIHTDSPRGCPRYRDQPYERFWSAAQDLGLPITLHIVTGRVPDALHFHTQKEHEETPGMLLAMFGEVMTVLANEFIFGQILDRFPGLKIVCGEFEISWIPWFLFRIDEMQGSFVHRLPFLPKLQMRASDYMKTRVWHGMINDPYGLDSIRHIGADRVLWGSDFPHVRSFGHDTQDGLMEMFKDLSPEDRDRVVGSNTAGVYGL